jgi:hypothetical protein
MSGPMKTLRLVAAALVVSGGLLVASCGGGSSVNTTPVATATSAPTVQSIPVSGGSLTLASSTSQVATLGFTAGAPAGIQLTASSSNTAPASAPVVTSLKRTPQSGPIAGAVPFFYVTFSVSANFSTQFLSSETVTLGPSNPTTATYGVEFVDMSTTPPTALGDAGPATIGGLIATFVNGANANSPTLTAGHTYLMMFFYIPAGTATPSPGPSSTASSSPSGSPSSSPSGSPSPSPSGSPSFTFSGSSPDPTGCSSSQCAVPLMFTDGPLMLQATFNSPTVTTTLNGNVATGASQISPSASFPFYTASGTVLLYFQASATPAASFPMTPGITLSGITASYPTGCIFYGYVAMGGSTPAWTQIAPSSGATHVSGGSVTIAPLTLGGGSTVDLSPTPFTGAIVCN